jgi:putative ABC transport system permease protein
MSQAKIVRNIRSGVENLLLHKLRSFLTMLGVVFGVGSVVAMLSVGEGASKAALDQIRRLGSTNIIISAVKPAQDEHAMVMRSMMSVYGLTYSDYQRIAESFSAVRLAAPVKLVRKDARLYERAMELRVVGTRPSWFRLVPREVLAGRVLSEGDVTSQTPVAVLTEFGARKILATEAVIGQPVRIGGNEFKVVGIVRSESGQAGDIQIPDQDIDAYIPIDVARSYFGDMSLRMTSGAFEAETVELHQIIVQVDDPAHVEAVAAGIQRMIEQFHTKKDYAISVPLALLRQAEQTKRTFSIVLGSIAGISLLVGGIGIMNIMLASVTERTREIGIRRAIGAKRRQIVYQFLIETVVLSTIGGLIGLGIGVLIPKLITHFSRMPTVVTLGGILLPLFISMAVGVLFGLYPAVNAAKVDPIIALRHE